MEHFISDGKISIFVLCEYNSELFGQQLAISEHYNQVMRPQSELYAREEDFSLFCLWFLTANVMIL